MNRSLGPHSGLGLRDLAAPGTNDRYGETARCIRKRRTATFRRLRQSRVNGAFPVDGRRRSAGFCGLLGYDRVFAGGGVSGMPGQDEGSG